MTNPWILYYSIETYSTYYSTVYHKSSAIRLYPWVPRLWGVGTDCRWHRLGGKIFRSKFQPLWTGALYVNFDAKWVRFDQFLIQSFNHRLGRRHFYWTQNTNIMELACALFPDYFSCHCHPSHRRNKNTGGDVEATTTKSINTWPHINWCCELTLQSNRDSFNHISNDQALRKSTKWTSSSMTKPQLVNPSSTKAI